MIRVKFISDTPARQNSSHKSSAYHWMNVYNRMSMGYLRWNDIQIIDPNEKKADYYVIINHPCLPSKNQDSIIDYFEPKKTILFQIEPLCVRNKSWGKYWKPNKDDFLFCHSIEEHRCYGWWEVNHDYFTLHKHFPKKKKTISTVMTSKFYHPGHKLRLEFFDKYLKKLSIDIWGYVLEKEDNRPEVIRDYENYKGTLKMRSKECAIDPYKYHFCCENSMQPNYFTEKIIDSLLCESLPLYWGCPNIKDFLPKDSFIWLPLDKSMQKSFEIVKSVIRNDEYKDRLPIIKKAKDIILNELNLFPTLESIIGG